MMEIILILVANVSFVHSCIFYPIACRKREISFPAGCQFVYLLLFPSRLLLHGWIVPYAC